MRSCGLLALVALTASAQTVQVVPSAVKQGETLHVTSAPNLTSARMSDRVIRLFPQPDGKDFGLMPVPIDLKAGKYSVEFLDSVGAVQQSAVVTVRDGRFASQNITLGNQIAELKPAPHESEDSAAFIKAVSDKRYWDEPLELPITGCMTSPFGFRRLLNRKPTGGSHMGIDQRGAEGAPIHAVAGGLVKLVRPWTLHGNTVGIDHGQGFESMYLHMSKFAVSEGALVKKGDVVGYVGSTGRSTAPHLHWSLYANGVAVNPAQWVKLSPCPPRRAVTRRSRKRSPQPIAATPGPPSEPAAH